MVGHLSKVLEPPRRNAQMRSHHVRLLRSWQRYCSTRVSHIDIRERIGSWSCLGVCLSVPYSLAVRVCVCVCACVCVCVCVCVCLCLSVSVCTRMSVSTCVTSTKVCLKDHSMSSICAWLTIFTAMDFFTFFIAVIRFLMTYETKVKGKNITKSYFTLNTVFYYLFILLLFLLPVIRFAMM